MYRIFWSTFLASSLLLSLVGCDRGNRGKAGTPEKMVVPVAYAETRLVTDYVDYTGRTNAKNSVVIQPRVTGYLIADEQTGRMAFKEGDFVKKGQELFRIDPRPYKAQLDAAKAAVAQNNAALVYAEATDDRYQKIFEKQPDAVSLRELDQYKALKKQALASLDLAKANLVAAELNFDWTVVKSPIDGQISRYYLTYGNLVNQDVTQLTTVVSLDPMYVYFDMDEPTLLRIKKAINEGKIRPRRETWESPEMIGASTFGLLATPLPRGPMLASSVLYPDRLGGGAPVLMALAGEDFNPNDKSRQGVINFIDNQVNPGTGSISVRGVFSNPKPDGGTYVLVPGMFVRVRLPVGDAQDALLVIDRAVTSEQGLKSVFVLDDKDKVDTRRVTTGALQDDGLRVITSGLKKDDRVLVGGLQQVRQGMVVPYELVSMPSLKNAAIPANNPAPKAKQGKNR